MQCDERVLDEAAVGFTDIGTGGILLHSLFTLVMLQWYLSAARAAVPAYGAYASAWFVNDLASQGVGFLQILLRQHA